MEQTNFEYMSDPARVERTVRNFMNLTLHELKGMQRKDCKYASIVSDTLICIEELDPVKAEHMDYMELSCLIGHVAGSSEYYFENTDGSVCDSKTYQLFSYRIMQNLVLDIYKKCIPVRLFLALPVQAFYEYLEKASGNRQLFFQYKDIERIYQKGEIGKGKSLAGQTIKDVLYACNSVLQRGWAPSTICISTYEQMILETLDVIGMLLVKSFGTAFPEKFHFSDVCSRYAADEESLFWEEPSYE